MSTHTEKNIDERNSSTTPHPSDAVVGKHVGTKFTREANGELLMTKECRYVRAKPEEVLQAFFFDDFFRSDAPVGEEMMYTSRQKHLIGGPGSFFDVDEFRPTYLKWLKSIGNKMTFTWVGETLEGSLCNALWSARWDIHVKEIDGDTHMTELFYVEGAPEPDIVWQGYFLQRVMKALVWLSNRLPIIRSLNRRLFSRTCVLFHRRHAAYETTIAKRIGLMRKEKK